MERLLTAEQAACLLGVTGAHVRKHLAARLGEVVVGYTQAGRPRRRYPMSIVQAAAVERAQRLAIEAAERHVREQKIKERNKEITLPATREVPSRKGGKR